jgi:hypothetical protein
MQRTTEAYIIIFMEKFTFPTVTTKETEWAPDVSSASGYVLDVTEDVVG